MNLKPLVYITTLVAALSACGGGGGTTSSSNEGTVSVLISDNLTLAYSEVWVNVQSISTKDASGQAISLYQDATGQVHNLSRLANVGALVDTATIPAGTYTSFDIVLGNDIKLVDLAGTVVNATFDNTGSLTFAMTVPGSLVVDATQNTTLALDFDLAQFTYDNATNTVSPVVVQKDPNTLNQTVATTQGQVQAVTSPTQFVVAPATGGSPLNVNLHGNATVTNATTGTVTSNTSGLQAGNTVSVTGNFDASTLSITASGVQIDNSAVSIRHEIEGYITAVNGGALTLDVKEANFRHAGNTMGMDVSNARFSRGNLGMLKVGQELEIRGSWDNVTFTPVIVEIEGAPSNSTGSGSYQHEYAELEGFIKSISNGMITLTVQEAEHVSGINVGSDVSIDSSNSWLKYGTASCLVAGAKIEAKGPMTGATAMNAVQIEIESGCGSSNSGGDDSDDDDHDDDD